MKTAKEVNDEILAVFKDGDNDRLFSLYSTSVVVREAPSLPFGGEYVGHDGLRRLLAAMGDSFDIEPTLLDVFEISDSLVIIYMSLRMAVPTTGEVVDMPVLELLTLRDGVVVEAVPFYWDTQQVVAMASRARSSQP